MKESMLERTVERAHVRRAVPAPLAWGVLCGAIAVGAAAGAHGTGAAGGATPTSPLGGPSVGAEAGSAGERTLVRYAYDGSLRPLETLPEIAAAEVLDLDEMVRAGVDEEILAHARAYDEFVIGHLVELMSVEGWIKTGQWMPVLRMVEDLRTVLGERLGPGGLEGRIARSLPEDVAGAYREMLREYERARVDEARVRAERAGERFDAVGFRVEQRLEGLRLALEGAFERVADSGQFFAEELFTRVELSEQSETRVRAVIQEHVTMWDGREPTKAEQFAVGWAIVAAVEGEEKGAVMKALLNFDE